MRLLHSVSSESFPPSARVSNIDGFSWVIDSPVRDMLGRAVFVTENELFLSAPEFAFQRSRTMQIVSLRECRFHAFEVFSRTERNCDARGHRSVLVENSLHLPAGDPKLTKEHGDHDGQEGELDARVLAPLYSSAGRRFRKWEDVVLDSFVCNYEDHPVTRRDESDILQSNWLLCTMTLRETHCVDLLTSQWRSTGVLRMPYTSSCKG